MDVRIDKWLWCARVFKTRSLATDACRNGRVTIGGSAIKPSREVRIGETLVVQKDELTRTFKVLGLLDKRVGAKIAKDFVEDLTPASEFEKKREPSFLPPMYRPKGAGRPTKKDRRAFDTLPNDE
ncbi:MAG: RNA-binding protein [Verrucomicrobiales bacterium]|nr:RNA-binding protein [Verrucomicrobiales bacterium]